jgi:cbb3-type cytochrome oxidase maturation protein
MISLVILLPLSVLLMTLAGALFVWAVNHDQFEQLDKHAFDVLDNETGDKEP